MEIKFIFKWFDMWIGFFWDREKKWLYFFPIPMCGMILKFKKMKTIYERNFENRNDLELRNDEILRQIHVSNGQIYKRNLQSGGNIIEVYGEKLKSIIKNFSAYYENDNKESDYDGILQNRWKIKFIPNTKIDKLICIAKCKHIQSFAPLKPGTGTITIPDIQVTDQEWILKYEINVYFNDDGSLNEIHSGMENEEKYIDKYNYKEN